VRTRVGGAGAEQFTRWCSGCDRGRTFSPVAATSLDAFKTFESDASRPESSRLRFSPILPARRCLVKCRSIEVQLERFSTTLPDREYG
jgi:hypothetical protein